MKKWGIQVRSQTSAKSEKHRYHVRVAEEPVWCVGYKVRDSKSVSRCYHIDRVEWSEFSGFLVDWQSGGMLALHPEKRPCPNAPPLPVSRRKPDKMRVIFTLVAGNDGSRRMRWWRHGPRTGDSGGRRARGGDDLGSMRRHAAKSEVDLRASHGPSLRLFRGVRALHSAVRGRAVRMGDEQDENSTLSSSKEECLYQIILDNADASEQDNLHV